MILHNPLNIIKNWQSRRIPPNTATIQQKVGTHQSKQSWMNNIFNYILKQISQWQKQLTSQMTFDSSQIIRANQFGIIVSIFNRIMSVNNHRKYQPIHLIIENSQNYLHCELQRYATYLKQVQNQITNTINMHFLTMNKQQQNYKITISQLQNQIIQLKEDNSFLRNQYMLKSIEQEEIKKNNLRILKQNAEKEERVRVLAQEVQTIKNNLNHFQETKNIVDFDQGEDGPFHFNQLQGLQTIKQVSEHDLSLTMSVQSLQSELVEENPKAQSNKDTAFSQQSLGAENYQIQNYQDALHFLKSYNKGKGLKMTKKSPDLELPISSERLIAQDTNKPVQRKGNETINKIKRMRKIQDRNKSSQQSMHQSVNEITSQDHIPITQSKIEYVDSPQQYEDKTKSSTSINSNKFRSRIKENIVNLEDPIKNVVQLLQHINAANVHAISRQKLKDQFHKISYVGGLSFLGSCNEFNQPSGFGKLLLNKEIIYQGQWRQGKFHGWGKLVLLTFVKQREKSIIAIDGHFECGMVQGSAICTFSNGQRFMGMIKNQSIEKEGTFVSEKGAMTGFWENNRLIYLI